MVHQRLAAFLLGAGAALGVAGFGAGTARAAEIPTEQAEQPLAQAPGSQGDLQLAQANVRVAQGNVPAPVAYEQGKGFYAAIGLGAQWPQAVDFNSDINGISRNPSGSIGGGGGGFSGDVGIGYDFGAIRAELTYGYSNGTYGGGGGAWDTPQSLRQSSLNNNGTNTYSKHDVLVSAYWDIETGSRWTPYIGGGIGWSNLSVPEIPGSSGAGKNLFGYQAKLGVSYGVSQSTDIYVEGVYQGTPGFSSSSPFGQTDFGSFNSWGAKLGARFRFGSSPTAVAVVEPAPSPAPPYTPPAASPAPAPEPIRGLW